MEILQSKDLYQADLLLVFIDGLQVGSIECLFDGWRVRDLSDNEAFYGSFDDVLNWFKTMNNAKIEKINITKESNQGNFSNPGQTEKVQLSCIK